MPVKRVRQRPKERIGGADRLDAQHARQLRAAGFTCRGCARRLAAGKVASPATQCSRAWRHQKSNELANCGKKRPAAARFLRAEASSRITAACLPKQIPIPRANASRLSRGKYVTLGLQLRFQQPRNQSHGDQKRQNSKQNGGCPQIGPDRAASHHERGAPLDHESGPSPQRLGRFDICRGD